MMNFVQWYRVQIFLCQIAENLISDYYFIFGLTRCRPESIQSENFLSNIGLGNIDVGYRRHKYLMSRQPMLFYGIILKYYGTWQKLSYLPTSRTSGMTRKGSEIS
jgi:hypothetical protein